MPGRLSGLNNRVSAVERSIMPISEIEDLLFSEVQIYGIEAIEKEVNIYGIDNVLERLSAILSSEEDTPILHETLEIIRGFLRENQRKH